MVSGPLHAAFARATDQIEGAVAIPVDDERIGVVALDPQGCAVALDDLGSGAELAFALSLEPVEPPREVAHHQIELTIAVPIHREGARADVLGESLTVQGND